MGIRIRREGNEDRHADAEVRTFSDRCTAICVARRLAKEYCTYEECYQEHDCSDYEGWVFHAGYSTEGDCVTVIKTTLNED